MMLMVHNEYEEVRGRREEEEEEDEEKKRVEEKEKTRRMWFVLFVGIVRLSDQMQM